MEQRLYKFTFQNINNSKGDSNKQINEVKKSRLVEETQQKEILKAKQ